MLLLYLDVAQLVERGIWDAEVAGSRPVIQTIFVFYYAGIVFNGQHTSFPNWEYGFKSCYLLQSRIKFGIPRHE